MRQGGPLSPLLFSLALHDVLLPLEDELKELGGPRWSVWYLGDGLFFGNRLTYVWIEDTFTIIIAFTTAQEVEVRIIINK